MRKHVGFVGLCCLTALVAIGCGDSTGDRPDGGDDGGGRDAIVLPDGDTDSGGDDDGGGTDDDGGGGGDDADTGECTVGRPCMPARGCESGECLGENATTIGGTDDPITGHPDGDESVPVTFWDDGYCVPRLPTAAMPETCDTMDEGACGDCASCVSLGGEPPQALCFKDCTPSGTDNGGCRDGYGCELSLEVCFPGCNNDDECRINRMDTNEDGEIDADSGDELVYDTDSMATCNMDTYRCDQPGTDGAVAGDTCVKNSECETDARCLSEAGFEGWTGGYCTKFRCDLEGRECAGDNSVCQERRIGLPACLQGCEVASGDWTEGDHASYTDVTGGCRDGYACNWNGADGAGVPGNGACLPGEFNDIDAPNIGGACSEDSDCYSPFGLGLCLTGGAWDPQGYCTVLDCGAPGVPTDVCGDGTQCLDADGTDGDLTWCLQSCEMADECGEGLGCVDYDGMADTSKVCFPGCQADEDCRADETCDIPAGEMLGECAAS